MARFNNLTLRKNRVRAKVHGTAERPRLSVFVSNKNITAQLINDDAGTTLAYATTVKSDIKGSLSEKAAKVGTLIAAQAKQKKISAVVFDRNGKAYAGRLHALANAAREKGLKF